MQCIVLFFIVLAVLPMIAFAQTVNDSLGDILEPSRFIDFFDPFEKNNPRPEPLDIKEVEVRTTAESVTFRVMFFHSISPPSAEKTNSVYGIIEIDPSPSS